jgi:hypothetical protein
MKKIVFLMAMFAVTATLFTSCKKDETTTTDTTPAATGIQAKWESSGADVAPLLVTLFKIDSIYAEFNTNNTYTVKQWDNTGTQLATLSGTYTQTKAATGNFYTIKINQTSPAALSTEGIFEITDGVMKYEVVQTTPDIGATPPTVAKGFGSTNNGALGMMNVQTYRKVN